VPETHFDAEIITALTRTMELDQLGLKETDFPDEGAVKDR
jgi:hypothetical protein